MSLSAFRSSFHLSRILPSSRPLLANSVPQTLFSMGQINTRTITRSLFYFSRNRDSDLIASISGKLPLSKACSCGIHTKGIPKSDQELSAFLAEEIENERKAHGSDKIVELEGFECSLKGSEVTLTKKLDKEILTIKSNVNNSVDAEETVMDPNENKDQQPQEPEMRAKPEFTVEIKKGNKILSFLCTYSEAMPDEEDAEPYNDSFQISEVSLYEGELEDSTYTVSGDIMDGYLYDLLMNYLEERGISNDFADKMIAFFTSYEHKLYINLLQGMKSFVEK